MNKPLLSICIPTYNRAEFLQVALSRLRKALLFCNQYDIEIIISDNHSEDDTQRIIESNIKDGFVCRYFRNETNIGPDANFIQCFYEASGKYIWLVGDDDYFIPDSLERICAILQNGDYGLIHIDFSTSNSDTSFSVLNYHNSVEILKAININITFMSGNIINSDSINSINATTYIGTYLAQVPFFINAAVKRKDNLIIHANPLDCGANNQNNGGYNFFEVFMNNYLSLWGECVSNGIISQKDFSQIKKATFYNFYIDYFIASMIGRPSQNLDTDGWLRITLHHFGNEIYFYSAIIKRIAKKIFKR